MKRGVILLCLLLVSSCQTFTKGEHNVTVSPGKEQQVDSIKRIAVVEINGTDESTLIKANMMLMEHGYEVVPQERVNTVVRKIKKKKRKDLKDEDKDEKSDARSTAVLVSRQMGVDAVVYGHLHEGGGPGGSDELTLKLIDNGNFVLAAYSGHDPWTKNYEPEAPNVENDVWRNARHVKEGLRRLLDIGGTAGAGQ